MEPNYDTLKTFIIENKLVDFKNKQTKIDVDNMLRVFFWILKNGSSWKAIKDLSFAVLSWNTYYYHFNKMSKNGAFVRMYKDCLDRYLEENKEEKQRILSADSTLIQNTASSYAEYTYTKKKKHVKISTIVDSKGIPLAVSLSGGKKSDFKSLEDDLDSPLVDLVSENNNGYLLADAGYDSKKLKIKARQLGRVPIIARNNRNSKVQRSKISEKNKKIFKKRLVVEHFFSWIKPNKRIRVCYERLPGTFFSFFILACIKLATNK